MLRQGIFASHNKYLAHYNKTFLRTFNRRTVEFPGGPESQAASQIGDQKLTRKVGMDYGLS
jgi:hypothetical protein